MSERSTLALFFLFCMLCVAPSHAKGPTVQLSIAGPGLTLPIHSSDPALLANLWVGNFAEWDSGHVSPPEADSAPFQIYFWMQVPRGNVEIKYVVRFSWLKDESRAVVCFPERDTRWAWINSATISRRQHVGKCLYAAEPWGTAVHEALNAARQ